MKSPFASVTLGRFFLCGALVLPALAAGPAAAQSTWYGAKQSPAVDDPRAAACLALALGRLEEAQDIYPPNGLARAAETLNVPVVIDALAKCRIALRAFPAEPKVIVAHYNAAYTLTVLLFGFK